jgi:hypothetical protein
VIPDSTAVSNGPCETLTRGGSGEGPAQSLLPSASLPRSWSTALVCIWQMRLSVTPRTWPISARVRPS